MCFNFQVDLQKTEIEKMQRSRKFKAFVKLKNIKILFPPFGFKPPTTPKKLHLNYLNYLIKQKIAKKYFKRYDRLLCI